jgi:hypothetical protein
VVPVTVQRIPTSDSDLEMRDASDSNDERELLWRASEPECGAVNLNELGPSDRTSLSGAGASHCCASDGPIWNPDPSDVFRDFGICQDILKDILGISVFQKISLGYP